MKVRDARALLEPLQGDELYRQARKLFTQEAEQLIEVRCHGKPTSTGVEGCLEQVSSWFRKVSPSLSWSGESTPENIISWESGSIYARYNLVDPKLDRWRQRTQREMLRGKPLPILEAMKSGDLEAASSFMIGKLTEDVKRWDELNKKREAFANQCGKRLCPQEAEGRHCSEQETLVLPSDAPFPSSTSDLVFCCKVEKCIKETTGDVPNR